MHYTLAPARHAPMPARVIPCAFAFLLGTAAAGVPCAAPAAAQPATGTVAGRVFDPDRVPVAGAVVRLVALGVAHGVETGADTAGRSTQTDALGRFALRGVRPGVVQLEVRRLGYASRVVTDVGVRPGRPAEVVVILDPAAVTLGGVTVRPSYVLTRAAPATPVSTAGFSTEQLHRAPGVQEDVVRALSVLPGVEPTTEGRNDLVVRGGAPAEILFVVDGLEVPNVSHFGAQGSTGGFGARYGDRASGVVDLALREGTRERNAGQLHLSILDAGASAEGPLGASGSFLAGARRSYLRPVLRALGATFLPTFEDVTFKAVTRPSPRDELSWFAVVGHSTVAVNTATALDQYEERDLVAPNETQYFTGATWRRALAHGSGRGAASITGGRTSQAFATEQRGAFFYGDPAQLIFRAHTTEAEEQLRATLVWAPGAARTTTWEAGAGCRSGAARAPHVRVPPALCRPSPPRYLATAMRHLAPPALRLDRRRGAALAAVLAAALIALAAVPASAQEPATVPAALAAELVDAGQTLRGSDAPTVIVGRLPDGFPAVPLPVGARVLGGALWRSGTSVALVQLDGSPPEARAREIAVLEGAGWKAPPPPPDFQDPTYPRFRSSTAPDPERDATRCAPGDSAGAVIIGARARDGRAIVRLLALPASRAGRCRPPQPLLRRMADRWARPPVPVLPPPGGVRIQPDGSAGSEQYDVTVTARAFPDSATGTLPVAATLLAHYARVLAAGGWTAAPVPGWDTTRATPLFVSPADSTGARWVASVDVRPDSGDLLADGRRVRVVPATVPRAESARGVTRAAAPALLLRLRVAQVGVGAPGNWGSTGGLAFASWSSSTRVVARDTARPRARPAGPPLARELVEALLGNSPVLGGNEPVGERLTDGRPPVGWRAPVPAMAGAHVLGGWRMDDGEEAFGSWLVLVATAPGSPADVVAAYGRQLDRAGWRVPPAGPGAEMDPGPSGFLSSTPRGRAARPGAVAVVRCAPGGDGYLTGSVDERTTGSGSLLRLMLLRGLRGLGGAGCTPEERASSRELRAPVPPLAAPAGFVVEQGQAGGGPFEWRMAATVRGGATSPAAIIAAYTTQLRAAGWTVDSAAASPLVAAAPLRRTVAAATDSSAAIGGPDAPMAALLAGPQEWSGLLSATRRPDSGYTVVFDVRRALGRGR